MQREVLLGRMWKIPCISSLGVIPKKTSQGNFDLSSPQGRCSFLVKADINEAYRTVPRDPEDQHSLDVHWKGSVFINKLPFHLHSAPKILSTMADIPYRRKFSRHEKFVKSLKTGLLHLFVHETTPDIHESHVNIKIL